MLKTRTAEEYSDLRRSIGQLAVKSEDGKQRLMARMATLEADLRLLGEDEGEQGSGSRSVMMMESHVMGVWMHGSGSMKTLWMR